MVTLLRFSKKSGLFKKEHALAAVVTVSAEATAEQDSADFREGFLSWTSEFGRSCKDLGFTFMATDEQQHHVFAFFRSLLADETVCTALCSVKLSLQFPSMSEAVADDTHARIYAKDV